MTSRRIALIANPRSGRGRVGRMLPRLHEELTEMGATWSSAVTEHAGHAIELASQAVADGADVIAAIGGDGTINEVVNGMLAVGSTPPALGIVPAGSGSDFARSFATPAGIEGAANRLAHADPQSIDVGTITFADRVRHFVNIAEVGLGAAVVDRAERLPRWLGSSRYLVAFWPAWARFSPVDIEVSTDAGGTFEGRCHNVVVANARYFGGGMHVAPDADPADGRLEIQLNIGSRRQAFTMIPKVRRGAHLDDTRVVRLHGSSVDIRPARPLGVEADGEPLGETPVTVSVSTRLPLIA